MEGQTLYLLPICYELSPWAPVWKVTASHSSQFPQGLCIPPVTELCAPAESKAADSRHPCIIQQLPGAAAQFGGICHRCLAVPPN